MSKRTLISLAAAFFLAASAEAQVHGTPAGATSLGGGHTFANPPGVPASATSVGPRGFAPQRGTFFQLPPQQNFHHGEQRVHRVIIPVAVPLYSYGAYPYLYSSYATGPEMNTADYRTVDPAVVAATQPQIVVAPVQQPPQIIVIDNRGVRDATDEEKQEALATRDKAAKKLKVEEPKVEVKPETEDIGPMTVLIFRNGSRREIKNYAIMGKELIVFGTGTMRRIQIAELDVPATVKENDVRGLDFKLP